MGNVLNKYINLYITYYILIIWIFTINRHILFKIGLEYLKQFNPIIRISIYRLLMYNYG